jgi:hypothetical protein
MKKLLVLGIMLLSLGGVGAEPIFPQPNLAQANEPSDEGEHFTFKGIPINGPLSEFTKKLALEGFVFVQKQENMAIYTGMFLGERVQVFAMEGNGNVYRVGVVFDETEIWSYLKNQYLNIKSMLTTKYGEPTSVKEEFNGFSDGDGLEIFALKNDRVTYFSTYQSADGSGLVQLKLSNLASVVLIYEDKINAERIENQYIDDL